ncbi:MAG: response regulator [Pseudomonadales bacterium]
MPHGQDYLAYFDPLEALEKIESVNHAYLSSTRSLTKKLVDMSIPNAIDVAASYAEQRLLGDRTKTKVFSVVVCDYLMPRMDGLEFFSRIKGLGVSRILLTGAADEKLAVDAFNEGLIDYFVLKSDVDAIPKLWGYAFRSQSSFFQYAQGSSASSLEELSGPLASREVWSNLWSLIEQRRYLDFCCSRDMNGFLMTRNDGVMVEHMFFTRRRLQQCGLALAELGAPKSILDRIEARSDFVCLDDLDLQLGAETFDWEGALMPISAFGESGLYWFGEREAPPIEIS